MSFCGKCAGRSYQYAVRSTYGCFGALGQIVSGALIAAGMIACVLQGYGLEKLYRFEIVPGANPICGDFVKFSHNHRPYATADANSAGFPMCVCAKKEGALRTLPILQFFGCVLCRGVAVVVIQESISFSLYLGQFLARLSLSHSAKVTVNRMILRNGLLLLCDNLAIALTLG